MTTVAEVMYCDVRCPSVRCHRFIMRIPVGTPIARMYCKGCGTVYENLVAVPNLT